MGRGLLVKKKPADQHKSGFMIRMPEEFRPVLEALQDKNDRPMTIELQRAVIAYAKAEGVACPPSPIFNGRRKE